MATVHDVTMTRKAVTRYAQYNGIEGTAELVCGSGYLFRRDGERQALLIHHTDPDLYLFGIVALVDAQRAKEDAAGGLVAMLASPLYYNGTTGRGTLTGGQ